MKKDIFINVTFQCSSTRYFIWLYMRTRINSFQFSTKIPFAICFQCTKGHGKKAMVCYIINVMVGIDFSRR